MPPSKTKSRKIQRHKRPSPRYKGILIWLLGAAGLAILLAASGFGFAATQEGHDVFCSSCHTMPESTFYQRSVAATPVDLASAHTAKQTRCIDCHSGSGTLGRMQAELLGAHNAFAWITHTAVQPAKLTHPIGDENCLKCHQQVISTAQVDINNHFHVFLARWQSISPAAARCTSCHQGHNTDVSAQQAYLNVPTTRQVCDDCHQALGRGE
jgi:predicted CXXCH cytochrome family protein